MGSPSATRWEAVTVRGCHLLQSLRSFHKWYPRLPSGQPPAEVARSAADVSRRHPLTVARSVVDVSLRHHLTVARSVVDVSLRLTEECAVDVSRRHPLIVARSAVDVSRRLSSG